MEKLDINIMEGVTEEKYNEARAEYIAKYQEYESGGFLSLGGYKNRPDVGEAKWNKVYPNGFHSWASDQHKLTGYGQQKLIDKINELVEEVNNLKK